MTNPTTAPLAAAHPGDALNAAIDAARIANPLLAEFPTELVFALPAGHETHSLPVPFALPDHIRQRVTVDTRDSLIGYTNRFSDPSSILIADYDKLTIAAHLDWHCHNGGDPIDPLAPRQDAHIARLILRDSEEFVRWNKLQGKLIEQAEFAQFLEENSEDIQTPSPAEMVELSRDLEGVAGQKFKAGNRLESGDRTFVFESETKVTSRIPIPSEFIIAIPLWQGEPPTELRCAFRYRVNDGYLMMGFEWRRVEYQRIGHFTRIATDVAEQTGLPVIYGRIT
jgi:uncharacterized protein YfdQ (DUF2303 family)